eukprot:scaffold310_cov307-Pinguiococcus_pyrenoidosus.AAC.9
MSLQPDTTPSRLSPPIESPAGPRRAARLRPERQRCHSQSFRKGQGQAKSICSAMRSSRRRPLACRFLQMSLPQLSHRLPLCRRNKGLRIRPRALGRLVQAPAPHVSHHFAHAQHAVVHLRRVLQVGLEQQPIIRHHGHIGGHFPASIVVVGVDHVAEAHEHRHWKGQEAGNPVRTGAVAVQRDRRGDLASFRSFFKHSKHLSNRSHAVNGHRTPQLRRNLHLSREDLLLNVIFAPALHIYALVQPTTTKRNFKNHSPTRLWRLRRLIQADFPQKRRGIRLQNRAQARVPAALGSVSEPRVNADAKGG